MEYKKKVVILFTNYGKWNHELPFRDSIMNRSYGIFAEHGAKKDLDVYVANYTAYKNGIIDKAWKYNKRVWEKIEDIKPDIIYSRFNKALYMGNVKNKRLVNLKHDMHEDIGLFNNPHVEEFCWDKCVVSELFPQYSPKSFLINTKKGLKIILPEIKTEKIVIKPRYGTLGENVIVTTKDNFPNKIEKNTLVQEFIDGSHGINGVTKGLHDMRVIVVNGKIDHCHVRIPKKGSLTANMSLGGDKMFIPNWKIPKKAIAIVKKVDSLLERFYPRLFSVDFIFDENQRPYIVECNGSPCMHRYAFGKYKKLNYYDHVLDTIKVGIKLKITREIR